MSEFKILVGTDNLSCHIVIVIDIVADIVHVALVRL